MPQSNPPVQITFTTVPIVGSNVPVTGAGQFVIAGNDSNGIDRMLLTDPTGALYITTSGSIPVNGTVTANIQQPLKIYNDTAVGVTGSVNVYTSGLQGVSGTVTAIIGNWPAAIGVSASATLPIQGVVGGTPIQVWSEGPIGVSGTITTTPFFSNTPQGVTGSINVYTSGLQGVSGTVGVNNFPATQNVSGTVIAAGPQPIGVSGSTFPIIVAGLDVSGSVRALRTDVLGNVFSNTPPRDRVSIVFQSTATATADTLLHLVKSINGNNQASATSIAVTAGKTLRITTMTFSVRANAAAAAFTTFTLRINASGAAVIGSQSELRVDLGNTEATVGAARAITLTFPGGFELTGAQQLAVSAASQATTNILSVALNGYEY